MVAFVVFAYAIPVPLSHLFSEVRVRNIIIEKGWYPGLKSIFQTSEAIRKENIEYLKSRIGTSVRRRLKVKITAEKTNPGESLTVSNEGREIRCSENELDLQVKMLNVDRRLSSQSSDMFSLKELTETHESYPLAPIVHRPEDLDVESGLDVSKEDDGFSYVSDILSGLSATEKSIYYKEELMTPLTEWQEDLPGSSSFPSRGKSLSVPDESIDLDETYRLEMELNLSSKNEDNDMKSILGICNDTVKIKTAFPGSSAEIIKILTDENFINFYRTYILEKLLKLLNDDVIETLYYKYFEFICILEGHSAMTVNDESLPNFIIPLINAWYITKKGYFKVREQDTIMAVNKTADNIAGLRYTSDTKRNERKRIINLMLRDKSSSHKYQTYLEELYDYEQNNEETNIYGW